MIFDRRWFLVPGLACALLAGCGDYSNEELEFMNALPESDGLAANLPARSSAISPADEAELARTTHGVVNDFNKLLEQLVGMVDAIRSYPPTSRTANSRVWGPFASDDLRDRNPDWQTRMIVSRDDANASAFNYEIAVHRIGTADLAWLPLIRGWFQAGGTAEWVTWRSSRPERAPRVSTCPT